MTPESARHKILPLTSARFFAAFLIVLLHTSHSPLGFVIPSEIEFMLGAGVDFFFVLSGFIITYTYGRIDSSAGVLNFWGARFSRIWPTHALTFLLCVALFPSTQWAMNQPAALPALANISMLHAAVPVPMYYFSFNGPSWSISTEMFFYLLYPLVIAGFYWKRWVPFAAAILGVGAAFAISLGLNLPPYGPDVVTHATSHGMMSISPLACFLEFVCGIYAAAAWAPLKARLKLSKLGFTGLEAVTLGVAIVAVVSFQHVAAALEAQHVSNAVVLWIRFHASAIFLGALVLVLALEGGYIAKLLSWRPLVVLGEISFSTYMLHQVVIRVMLAQGWHTPDGYNAGMFVAFLVLIIGLSYVVWSVVEKPSRRALNKLFHHTTVRD